MTRDLDATRNDVLAELRKRKLDVSDQALKPLQRIDFKRLVQVHDHEERFLFETFVSSLLTAHKARVKGRGPQPVNAHDVRIALLMLGAATATASDQMISGFNKQMVKDACPYC